MEGKMSKIFVQVEGDGKGTEVEIIKEDGRGLVLRNLENKFEYRISLRSFWKGYKEKESAKNRGT